MSPQIKTALLAAAAAAAFVAASFVAIQPSRAEAYVGDRYNYRVDTRYDSNGYRIDPGFSRGFPGSRLPRVTASARAGGDMPFPVKQFRARRMAVAAWQEKVTNRFGYEYARWYAARDPHVQCDAGVGSVYCEVSAIPSRGWRHWSQVRE